MFHNKLILGLLFLGCIALSATQMSVNLRKAKIPGAEPIAPEADTAHPATTTTTTTSTTTTTTATTTTAAPTTTPTTARTTTTTTSTTTPAPTTTQAPNTTTTVAPTTTTPKPTPYPDPEIGTWNSSCIMVRFAAQLNFTYETKDNKTASRLYNIPKNAVVEDAHCNTNNTQYLQVNWGPVEAQHSMVLQFDKNNGTASLKMMMFNLPLISDNFPDAKDNQTIQLLHRGDEFSVPLKMSYHCTRPQTFNLTETLMHSQVIGTVKVHDVQVEAFRDPNAKGFSTARDCDSSETSDVVPIAVGIALVALIVIVLISYLCARRRSTSRGYMSF